MHGSSRSCPCCAERMKNFVIIVNALKDESLKETAKLCSYIRTRGGRCQYLVSVDAREGIQKIHAGQIPPDTECIFVLGGDGTLIRAARDTVSCRVPLIGINMGTLGYLCEMEIDSVCEAVDAVMRDEYMLEERMMLSGKMQRAAAGRAASPAVCRCRALDEQMETGDKQASFHALNDIVIHRAGPLSLVSLIVYVNGEYLNTFKGDGIILSTPTGSTGYNLSAGGPIVDPKARLILLTPINSHTLTPKSIVIDARDEVVVEIGSRRVQRDEAVEVSFDGDRGFQLAVGDRIEVCRASACARILRLSKISFLEILRKKMQTFH